MTHAATSPTHSAPAMSPPARWIASLICAMDAIPHALVQLAARVFPASVFWMSGQTKVEGWRVSETAIALFQDEYKLPFLDPTIGAHLAAFAEHFFSVAAGHRPCQPLCRAGAAWHDAGDSDFRLSRRMADAWRLGRMLPCRHRARRRGDLAGCINCARILAPHRLIFPICSRLEKAAQRCAAFLPPQIRNGQSFAALTSRGAA